MTKFPGPEEAGMDKAEAYASVSRAEALQMEIMEALNKHTDDGVTVFEAMLACLGAAASIIKSVSRIDPKMGDALRREMKKSAPGWADGEFFQEDDTAGVH
jgi:hypothetical protein